MKHERSSSTAAAVSVEVCVPRMSAFPVGHGTGNRCCSSDSHGHGCSDNCCGCGSEVLVVMVAVLLLLVVGGVSGPECPAHQGLLRATSTAPTLLA